MNIEWVVRRKARSSRYGACGVRASVLECVRLAGAVGRVVRLESGSKLAALQTLRAIVALLWAAGAWPAFSQTSPSYAWTNFAGRLGGQTKLVVGDQEVSQFSDGITVNCAPLA